MCVHQSAHTSVLNHVTWPSQKPSPPTIQYIQYFGGIDQSVYQIRGTWLCVSEDRCASVPLKTTTNDSCVSFVCKNDIMVMVPMNFGSFPAFLTISSSFSNYFTNNYVDLLLKTNLVLTISPIILEYHYHHMINAHFSCEKNLLLFSVSHPEVMSRLSALACLESRGRLPPWDWGVNGKGHQSRLMGLKMGFFQVYPSRIAI